MPGKILVVDDVATNRIILKAKLAIACYDVIQAADGEAALELARTERPDLILLDLSMPGMSGFDVLAALKAEHRTAHIPVVVVTSHSDRRSRIAALQAGAEDFLTKPVDDMILAARVRSLLRVRLMSDELALRESTRRALGFSEAQAAFRPAAGAPGAVSAPGATGWPRESAGNRARADGVAGRIALIDVAGVDNAWIAALGEWLPHRFERMGRADAMRLARAGGANAFGTTAFAPDAPPAERHALLSDGSQEQAGADHVPEVFVLAVGLNGAHDGLMLLSELRASPATAHAAILVALPEDAHAQTAIALDLGASDVLTLPLDPEETALRLSTQLHRTREALAHRRKLREGLQLAVTDALTGLPNRRYGLSHLERAFERALERSEGIAALMLDLDRFKDVNDLYGHAAGDAVLRSVAARLEAHLRPVDLLARIGGEEFLVVLQNTEPSDALETADRLRRAIDAIPIAVPPPSDMPQGAAAPRFAGGRLPELHQTVSIGLATGPTPGDAGRAARDGLAAAARAFLERADSALLGAKAAGRNCVVRSTCGRAGEAAA